LVEVIQKGNMNSWTKTFSVILVVGGALMIAVAIVADWIGLGSPGFSLKQILLVLVGAAMLLIALALSMRRLHKLSLFLNRYGGYLIVGSLVATLCFGYLVGNAQLVSKTQEYLSYRNFLSALPQITPSDNVINLQLRNYHIAADPEKYDTELDSYFVTSQKQIPVKRAALILVDVWESGTNDGHTERTKEIFPIIYEVLQAARENHMLVIHAAAQAKEAELVKPLANEVVVDYFNCIPDDEELDMVLKHYNIHTLFYIGFATNMCILDKPYGMKKMYSLGYEVILVRDATTGVEFHDTLDGMWATELAIRYVEYALGYSCTAYDFIQGLQN
jgi:nicotinamidase-related amidase